MPETEEIKPRLKVKLIEELVRAYKASVPLTLIETFDQPAVVTSMSQLEVPVIMWDAARGLQSCNELGKPALAAMLGNKVPSAFNQLPDALNAAAKLPESTHLIVLNGQRCTPEIPAGLIPIQAIANLRDQFKQNNRMLVLLGPSFALPPELASDALTIDDPLPSSEDLRSMLMEFCDTALEDEKIKYTKDSLDRAVEAVRGLSEFAAEQAFALSMVRNAKKEPVLDIDRLWARKRQMINATPGLKVEKVGETFEQIGGMGQIKIFSERYCNGPRHPAVVILIDEIDKSMAGAGQNGAGDNTGATQDQHALLLKNMEDNNYNGFLPVGPAGTGKTLVARAIAATYKIPCISLDMASMKSSLLGSSEARGRAAFKMINAIAGEGGAFFVGTCNGLDELSPALRRRFRAGIWFFDLPEPDERENIGAIQLKRYNLKLEEKELAFWSSCKDWSGANIRDCCEMAYSLQVPISVAADFIVPAGEQDQSIDQLRRMADGKYLCAGYRGKYDLSRLKLSVPEEKKPARRLRT